MMVPEILDKYIQEYNNENDPDRKYWLKKNIDRTKERLKKYEEINKNTFIHETNTRST